MNKMTDAIEKLEDVNNLIELYQQETNLEEASGMETNKCQMSPSRREGNADTARRALKKKF